MAVCPGSQRLLDQGLTRPNAAESAWSRLRRSMDRRSGRRFARPVLESSAEADAAYVRDLGLGRWGRPLVAQPAAWPREHPHDAEALRALRRSRRRAKKRVNQGRLTDFSTPEAKQKSPVSRAFLYGASRARTGDLLNAIQPVVHLPGMESPRFDLLGWSQARTSPLILQDHGKPAAMSAGRCSLV